MNANSSPSLSSNIETEVSSLASISSSSSSSTSSVIVDEAYLNVKHPLKNSWTLWYYKYDRSKPWLDNLREVFSFKTIEDFWGLYSYLKTPSSLPPGSDYSLFKTGIVPMWEDARNRKGGRWLVTFEKYIRSPSSLDGTWLELLLLLIGGQVASEDINGGYLNVRNKGDKVALWMQDINNTDTVLKVGRVLKERLGIQKHLRISFEAHQDSCKKTGSVTKSLYSV